MVCTHVTQHLLNGVVPTGRTYVHQCRSCQAQFETESVMRGIYNFGFGVVCLPFGLFGVAMTVALIIDAIHGSSHMPSLREMGIGLVLWIMLAIGFLLPIRSVVRAVRVLRNPVA